MITPRPAPEGLELKPAFPMIPFFGVEPCLMDNEVCANHYQPYCLRMCTECKHVAVALCTGAHFPNVIFVCLL